MEKCLRGAQPSVTRMMIEEMLNTNELEKMLSDSFANYVVQTALEYADSETKNRLVDAIRPILPSIRQTPYGRRIQSKILGGESQGRGRLSGGPATPNDHSSPGQIPLAKAIRSSPTANPYGIPSVNGFQGINNTYAAPVQAAYQTNGIVKNLPSYAPSSPSSSTMHSQTFSNVSNYTQFTSDDGQNPVQQPTASYTRAPVANVFNYF